MKSAKRKQQEGAVLRLQLLELHHNLGMLDSNAFNHLSICNHAKLETSTPLAFTRQMQ